MRGISTTLLIAVALVASGSCLAQQAEATTAPPAQSRSDASAAATGTPKTEGTRSAFGKVIALMISSLQRQAHEDARPTAPARTSASGTPLGIEVGAAFRNDASSLPDPASRPSGASPPSSAATLPEYAVRPAALAGTD